MCQHNLPCSIVYAHCLLPGRAFASLYVLLFLEKEAEIGGRVLGKPYFLEWSNICNSFLNSFMPNVFSHPYQLDESISNFRVVGWYDSFLFKFYKKLLFANSGEPHKTPHFAASDLVLHCLPMSHKKNARLIWVKITIILIHNITTFCLYIYLTAKETHIFNIHFIPETLIKFYPK